MAYKGDDLDLRAPQGTGPQTPSGMSYGGDGDGAIGPRVRSRGNGQYQNGAHRSPALYVDETLLACCNHAYDIASANGAREVMLEHLVHALTRVPEAAQILENRGVHVMALRRESATIIANDLPISPTHSGTQARASSDFDACVARSYPRSAMNRIALGLMRPDGADPALAASTDAPPCMRAKASAIWLRLEFSTQTNSTRFMVSGLAGAWSGAHFASDLCRPHGSPARSPHRLEAHDGRPQAQRIRGNSLPFRRNDHTPLATMRREWTCRIAMASTHPADTSALLTRSELEFELARMALALMRAAPHAFATYGVCSPDAPASQPSPNDFAQAAARLLSRTRRRHREFVSARLRELARSCAGLYFDGFDAWLAHDPAPAGQDRRRTPRPVSPAATHPAR